MDEAAAAARGVTTVSQALEAPRLAWGDVYMFGRDEEGYWAARPDRPGTGIHRAGDPEELCRLLADDFGSEPS